MSHVLIIEDDPFIALDLAQTVSRMGHSVLGPAAWEDDAVSLAANSEPDLILADVRLAAGGSGIEAVKQITRRRRVPVIFVTGNARNVALDLALEPVAVIAKPFSGPYLESVVRNALKSGASGLADRPVAGHA